jgi:hypothetical protein
MNPHPWFHPTNVYTAHQAALELMVEILEAAVNDALPEARRRHPLPGSIPGALLGPLVRDGAREIALSTVFERQTLRATPAPNMALHLITRDDLLRIRTRKLPDPEQPVPTDEQLELQYPDDWANTSLFGQVPELALFWAVKGEALYRVILAAPVGWEDEASLTTWYGAVEIKAPAVRTLLWPLPGKPTRPAQAAMSQPDDLDDVIRPQVKPDTEEDEVPGNAS